MSNITYEVELALVKPLILENEIFNLLPNGFYMEVNENGWGLILRVDHKIDNNLEEMIVDLLNPLTVLSEIIEKSQAVLRIAVYNPFFTCNIQLDNIQLLAKLNIIPRISIYPTSEESDD